MYHATSLKFIAYLINLSKLLCGRVDKSADSAAMMMQSHTLMQLMYMELGEWPSGGCC